MEENSENMDTGVSSTTDDVQEVEEVASTHHNVETVITVESIKEEDMSPRSSKQAAETKTSDKTDSTKPTSTPFPELTIKKIVIKSPLKDLPVRPVQKALNPEKTQKDLSPNKSMQPSTSQNPQTVESISTVDTIQSPTKCGEKTVQRTAVNISESQKPVQKSPVKELQLQEPATKDAVAKQSPNEKQIPSKDPPIILVLSKDNVTKSPVKEPIVNSTAKVGKKITLFRSSPAKTANEGKEVLPKQTPSNNPPPDEAPAKRSTEKENPSKTPTKDNATKPSSVKESPPQQSPVKEVLAKQTQIKEVPAKPVLSKEQPENETPTKEPSSKIPSAEPPVQKPIENVKNLQENKESSNKNKNLSLLDDKEASNDSQIETCSDTSEKEHNRSISRELRSLINSAKESKIISECTQLTSKTRKSRTPLDTSNTSLNASADAEKIQGVRRSSNNSQRSNSSELSDKSAVKRSMRSQNPEFVSKVKSFLNSVSGKTQKVEDDEIGDKNEGKNKDSKENLKESSPSLPKKKKSEEVVAMKPAIEQVTMGKDGKIRVDPYCWRCHWGIEATGTDKPHPKVHCTVCPRSFHFKCLTGPERSKVQPDKAWVCPECMSILQAESSDTRSPAMKKISLGMLCDLLKHALERMMEVNSVEPFMHPVDRTQFPDYDNYVVHPMDLTLMKQHIDEGLYGSTEAFLADAQWILHNSVIFNTFQAKLTGGARALVRSCRAEMGEIEACPECYAAAHARKPTWFTDVCSTPHILLWAKLKGFPYWPAKGMSVSSAGLVDVRFFGAHDRAWVPARDCFLYSEKDPNNFRTKRQDILDSMQEAEQHIRNISRKYGKFVYPPFRTAFEPSKLTEQIKMMIPSFEGEVRSHVKDKPPNSSPASLKEKRRSMSKSSKDYLNDGDTSEGEDPSVPSRKMASGAEIAREEDYAVEKDKEKPMEVDPQESKENETSRKRRRSCLEEAVITIIDNTKEKRKRVDNDDKAEKKDSKETTENKEKTETKEKEQEKPKVDATAAPKSKDTQPSTSTDDKKASPKATPIRVISIAKVMKQDKVSPKINFVKEKEDAKSPKQKTKPDKAEKDKATPQDDKKAKRRNSKNKSFNNSNVGKSDKTEKKNDKPESNGKEKAKDKDGTLNKTNELDTSKSSSSTDVASSSKDRIQIDDDTSLAVLARKAKTNSNNGLPTISSVRSLSTQNSTTPGSKTLEITVEASQDSSIFTPTSTENVRNMKEAVNKLQKLRGDNDPPPQVGRVGVRAFARMSSPPQKETPKDVQVEIKTEPMDFEESERQLQEKMDLMNAFKLRPVNPQANTGGLRDVRINKVVVTPVTRKGSTPQPVPMRAKKTFPQPKKPDEGRSELTSKNSMVYIPIQPPATQAPRAARPNVSVVATTPHNRNVTTVSSNANNNAVNTITPPLVFSSPTVSSTPTSSTTPIQTVATIGQMPTIGQISSIGQLSNMGQLSGIGPVPTVGQVPSTVHTMPLITSVNGQWTFSLQPVLSVGGVDDTPSPPMVNGIADRTTLLPIAPAPNTSGTVLVPTTAVPNQQNKSNESAPGEPPRLQQRPALVNPLDSNAPVGCMPPPSTVGPLTAKLNQNAVKMTDFFRTLLEDSIEKLDDPSAQSTALKLQLEQQQWRHTQEVNEIKHTHELMLAEMRSSFEKEKIRLVAETRRQSQVELDAAVKLAKTKQWCANCNQEAQFYCCWNTSYCDYPCQRAHWATHYAVCAQQRHQDNSGDKNAGPSESRLQQAPDNLPKTTAAPNLAAASKLQPSRMYTQDPSGQKASIIVSMVEDNTGNPTMKCLGTYKPPPGQPQMTPLIINKQIMNNEETAKKVVTSGGYLIVGASNSTNSTASARRATAIQYIS